jgi:hypothetical protein
VTQLRAPHDEDRLEAQLGDHAETTDDTREVRI